MKKIIALLLAFVLMFTLSACSVREIEPASTLTATPSDTDSSDSAEETDSVEAEIILGDTITVSGSGTIVEGKKVSITAAGTYYISGASSNAQIQVYTKGNGTVNLILNGVDISCPTSAPIYIINADKTVITLTDGTENSVTDGASYVFENAASNEPNAAIFSNDDLTINGNGSLTVNANYNDGIHSDDDLKITGGDITVNAVDDGINGRDSLTIKDGDISVNASGHGMRASNDEDTAEGYITIEGGTINITAGVDGIHAETAVTIEGGDIIINAYDNSIYSHGNQTINGGNIVMASGGNGIHADFSIEINGGYINFTQCYEGIEGAVITINGGDIHIVSSDDGISVSIGCKSTKNRAQGLCHDEYRGYEHLYINSGCIVIDAGDDGIDTPGPINMTGGVVIINHYSADALDHGSVVEVAGGLLIVVDDHRPIRDSYNVSTTQLSVVLNYRLLQPAGTMVHIDTESGQEILTFVPTEVYQSVALCSPKLEMGTTYVVYSGGSSTGTVADGLYSDGTYMAGTQITSFTISRIVTRLDIH